MKKILSIFILAIALNSFADGPVPTVREATVSEMQSGSIGLPAVVTPRRAGVGFDSTATNLANTTVFNIKNTYTNVGGGVILTSVCMFSNSVTLTASNVFTTGDVGKSILIYGLQWETNLGILTTNCISGTVTNVPNAPSNTIQITVSAPRGTTNMYGVTSTQWPIAVMGFDDTPNIQTFMQTCAASISNGVIGDLFFPAGIYVVAGPLYDPILGTNDVQHLNSQLYIPLFKANALAPTFTIRGEQPMTWGEPGGSGSTFPRTPNKQSGTTLWSFYVPTNGAPQDADQGESVLTCKNWNDPGFTGGSPNNAITGGYPNQNQVGMNQVHVVIKNLALNVPSNPHITGLDMRGCGSGCYMADLQIGQGFGQNFNWIPVYTNSYGVRMPINFNDLPSGMDRVLIQDFFIGTELGEDNVLVGDYISNCYVGMQTRVGGHYCSIYGTAISGAVNVVRVWDSWESGGGFGFNMLGDITTETGGINIWGIGNIVGLRDDTSQLTGHLYVQGTSGGFTNVGGTYMDVPFKDGTVAFLQNQNYVNFRKGVTIGISTTDPTTISGGTDSKYVITPTSNGAALQFQSKFNSRQRDFMYMYENNGDVIINAGSLESGYQGGETNLFLGWGFYAGGTNSIITNGVAILNGSFTGNARNSTNQMTTNIVATAAGDSSRAGFMGEFTNKLVASGAAQALVNNTPTNVTSILLAAGDWDVEGSVHFSLTGATTTSFKAGITTTSATIPTDGSEGYSAVVTTALTDTETITIARFRVNISSATTVYLVGQSAFSLGSEGVFGNLSARRAR